MKRILFVILLILSCSNLKKEHKWFCFGFEKGCEQIINENKLVAKIFIGPYYWIDLIETIDEIEFEELAIGESAKIENLKDFEKHKIATRFGIYLSYLFYLELLDVAKDDINELQSTRSSRRYIMEQHLKNPRKTPYNTDEYVLSLLKEEKNIEKRIEATHREFTQHLREKFDEYEKEGWKIYLKEKSELRKRGWDKYDKEKLKLKWGIKDFSKK